MFFKKSNKKCGLKTLCYFNVQSYAFYVKIFLLLVCLVSFIPGCNALSSVLRSSLKKGRIDSTEAKKKKKKKDSVNDSLAGTSQLLSLLCLARHGTQC